MLPGVAVVLFLIGGCATQQRSQYPVLEPTLPSDAGLDCAALDDEVLKANAIRDAIYAEHGDVVSGAIAGSALEIAMDPLGGAISSLFGAAATSKAAKQYIRAAAAAELRMEYLLISKQKLSCPDSATADPALTEAAILAGLQEQKLLLDADKVSRRQYVFERRRLFDALR